MLGDIKEVSENLWFIEGEMPSNVDKSPDVANVIIYRSKERLYLIDSGVGYKIRDSIKKVIDENNAKEIFLLNSHGHADHVANNDVIYSSIAEKKYLYLSEKGIALLDYKTYFGDLFFRLSEYFNPLSGYKANKLKYRFAKYFWDFLSFCLGKKESTKILISFPLKKFSPYNPMKENIIFYESLKKQGLNISGISWTGWVFGENEVIALEERAHSPDEIIFYIPEKKLLFLGDLSFPLYPTWLDSDSDKVQEFLKKCLSMVKSGEVKILADSHHHKLFLEKNEMIGLLEGIISDHCLFRSILTEIVEKEEGLCVGEIYARFSEKKGAVVKRYLDLEYPHSPPSLQSVIAGCLVQMKFRAEGKWGSKRFYKN